jgi:hypothetical protein
LHDHTFVAEEATQTSLNSGRSDPSIDEIARQKSPLTAALQTESEAQLMPLVSLQ